MSDSGMRVWLVDDDSSTCWLLERALRNCGISPRAFQSAESALDALSGDAPEVLVTDTRLPGQSGFDLLRKGHEIRPELPIIVTTAHSDLGNAVSAYEGGAFEYLPKPFDLDQAVALIRHAGTAKAKPADESTRPPAISDLLGVAPAMQHVFRAIGRLARSSATVLVTGESGNGKELVARALHDHSPRSDKSFIALNASAIPAELLEAELFGQEEDALPSHKSQRLGLFERATVGTIFLDEVADISTAMQTRLLRVLTAGEFYRVGGQEPIHTNTRVIAATHRNLADRVKQGTFREDLYHRLNVIQIQIPPLRARPEDIPGLLHHYFGAAAQELGIEPKSLEKKAEERLLMYQWPGNVRELVNLCMGLSVSAPGNEIRLEDLPPELVTGEASALLDSDWAHSLRTWADRAVMSGHCPLLEEAVPKFEKALIGAALKFTQGHRREAAERIGWGRNTLTQKIREHGMGRSEVNAPTSDRTQ